MVIHMHILLRIWYGYLCLIELQLYLFSLTARHHTLGPRQTGKELAMTAITFTARKIADAGKARSQCAVIPLFSDKKPGGAARLLDKASAGAVSAALALGDFSGKAGQSLLLPGQ